MQPCHKSFHSDCGLQSNMSLSRRAFIKLTGTTVACTCIGALATSGCAGDPTSSTPPLPEGSYRVQNGRLYVALSEVGTLLDLGGAAKCTLEDVAGSEQKLIIVRLGDADYRAFADACTHNGKELNYLHLEGLLACCGRSSRFNLTGEVMRGPAEDALTSYRVWEDRGELVIEI
jgi:nitrite reductase/ring-hydroxylating ferredoxin subunit